MYIVGGVIRNYLAGQVINIGIGLVVLWLFDIEQYAIYTIGGLINGVGAVVANMGVLSAVTYFTSRDGSANSERANMIRAGNVIQSYLIILAVIIVAFMCVVYGHQLGDNNHIVQLILACILHVTIAARLQFWRACTAITRRSFSDQIRRVGGHRASGLVAPLVLLVPTMNAASVLALGALAQLCGLRVLQRRLPATSGSQKRQSASANATVHGAAMAR